jgi:pyrroline-5-carboxylate reductase
LSNADGPALIRVFVFMISLEELSQALVGLGCPADKAPEMAAQLDKRARQLAEQKGQSYEDAMAHLLSLMRQGWAAQGRV